MSRWAGPETGVYILHVKKVCMVFLLQHVYNYFSRTRVPKNKFFFFFVTGATKVSLVFPNSGTEII